MSAPEASAVYTNTDAIMSMLVVDQNRIPILMLVQMLGKPLRIVPILIQFRS